MNYQNVEKNLQRLASHKRSPYKILSLYLGFKDKKSPSGTVLVTLFHLLIHKSLTSLEKKAFREDLKKIEKYLQESFDTRGNRSIVFFTAGAHLFKVLQFEFYLPPDVSISYSPNVAPIVETISRYGAYLVLLADRKRARLFTVHLGKIEEHEDIVNGFVPQKVKHGDDTWDAQDKILRHIEDHLHRHLKLIAQSVDDFVKQKRIEFIILGGHKEFFNKIKKHLPKRLAKKVLGELVTEINIPLNDVFLRSKKVAQNIGKGVHL
ncbi:MAG: hypothetical protein A3D74_05550 [Candidatus Levybacteria bacterium RIFCSPHIGHO2_02_FULL_37_13]|nr:MAG: hypothetical protein A3D74_05550 [Candidatus Levybacteria bacterium RIFCSPHIGHO2_02_FULL_37_13]OGH29122.1 MAG: hypothetical protein A3E40_03180 [Candidatus Levybacteria bacterium RIFCSPHIGHO2_12_FULL_37_9]OGH40409.1 MAG: hypothetical protein A3B41_02775 [Candidatus Levybacteria bacterium RIFCSPLOWO2_01_FULL_37_26]